MSRSARATAFAVLAVILCLGGGVTACTGDDDEPALPVDDEAAPSDTGPSTTSARATPFCAGMIELGERLDETDEADTAALIRSTYADLADVVPEEIRADFEAVRQLLVEQADGTATTGTSLAVPSTSEVPVATAADGDGEGATIAGTPTERLTDYVELICRSTANNPGPPETEPP